MSAVVYLEHVLTPAKRQALPVRKRGRVRDYAPDWQRPFICLVNGKPLLRADWDRPILEGEVVAFVDVRAIPQGGGGGGSDPLRVVATIAVMAIAPVAGGYLAAELGITGAIGTSLLTAGVAMAGSMLVNAVLPPPKLPTPQAASALAAPSPTYNLQAQGNTARLEQAIPEHFGRMIAFPDFAAMPYTEYAGNEQYLYQLLALGRGEYDIEQIRIDDTPISSFEEIEYEVVPPHGQVTLFPANVHTSIEVSGQEIDGTIGPFVAAASGTQANHIGVDFVCPKGLFYANNNGGLDQRSVQVRVEAVQIDDNGAELGIWFTLGEHTYTAATNTPQRFSERYAVAPGRYKVRVTRLDAKDTSARAGHDIHWTALRAYLADTRDYGDVTLIAMRMRASNNLSQRASRKVNVIATRKLPAWDGAAWSAPQPTRSIAWAFAYACKQMGLNDAQIDLAELKRLDAVWSARGDTFDGRFDSGISFWEALTKIAQAGRAKPFMQAGVMRIARDEPQSVPVAMYTSRNIVKNSLTVDYLMPTQETADAVDVGYFDENFWAPRRVRAALPDSAASKPAKVDLFGVVNRDQAYREGIYQAASNRYRRKMIRFATEMEGFIPSFGDLIYIQHDMPAWGQAGEIVAWDAQTLTAITSEPLTWESGQTHYMALRTADGGVDGPYQVTQGGSANEAVFAVAPVVTPYTGADQERTHYSFGWGSAWRQPARVVSVRPHDALTVEIEAVNEDAAVHTADQGVFAPAPPTSQLKREDPAPAITGLNVKPITVSKFTASWNAAPGASYYVIEQSPDGVTWTRLADVSGASYSGAVDYADRSQIRVAAVGQAQGPWATVNFGDILREPLPDVEGLAVVYRDGVPYLVWSPVSAPPRQGVGYEVRKGASWAGAEVVGRTFSTEMQALGAGTYWVRAYHGPAWSVNPVAIATTGALVRNVIVSFDEAAQGWPGVYDASKMCVDRDDLMLTGTGLFSSIPQVGAECSIVHYGPHAAQAVYELPASEIVDIGTAQPCQVQAAYRSYAARAGAYFSDIPQVSAEPSIVGDFSNIAGVKIQLAVADDALNWGDWFDYVPGTYVGRAFKARAVFSTSDENIYAALDQFSFSVDMPDKIEIGNDVVIPSAGETVAFVKTFHAVPNIQITVQDAQAGDVPVVSNKSKTGFAVQVLNNGAGVQRIIDWTAQGY